MDLLTLVAAAKHAPAAATIHQRLSGRPMYECARCAYEFIAARDLFDAELYLARTTFCDPCNTDEPVSCENCGVDLTLLKG